MPKLLWWFQGGWRFLMSEAPLSRDLYCMCYQHGRPTQTVFEQNLQGYLAHKKQPLPS